MSLYGRQEVAAGTLVGVSVSGTVPAPDASASAEQGQEGRDAQQGGGEVASANIQRVPGRLDGLKWYLIGGFVCVFVLLAILLARKPVVAVGGRLARGEEKHAAAKREKKERGAPRRSAAPGPPNGC